MHIWTRLLLAERFIQKALNLTIGCMLGDECDVSSTEMDGHVICLRTVPMSNMGEVNLPWVNYRQIFFESCLEKLKKIPYFCSRWRPRVLLYCFLSYTSPCIRCGIISCCEPWSSTASYIFDLGSGLLLELVCLLFHFPHNFKYPLLAFSRQNTDNRSKARTVCVGLDKSGWLSGEQLTWCCWVGCCKTHWFITELRSK